MLYAKLRAYTNLNWLVFSVMIFTQNYVELEFRFVFLLRKQSKYISSQIIGRYTIFLCPISERPPGIVYLFLITIIWD